MKNNNLILWEQSKLIHKAKIQIGYYNKNIIEKKFLLGPFPHGRLCIKSLFIIRWVDMI